MNEWDKSIVVSYYDERTGGEVWEGQENEAYPYYHDTITDFRIEFCTKTKEGAQFQREVMETSFVPMIGQEVWIVVVRYTTGDTFGSTLGCFHFIGVYESKEEANNIGTSIENKTYEEYSPWIGYFEEFERVEITKWTVKI